MVNLSEHKTQKKKPPIISENLKKALVFWVFLLKSKNPLCREQRHPFEDCRLQKSNQPRRQRERERWVYHTTEIQEITTEGLSGPPKEAPPHIQASSFHPPCNAPPLISDKEWDEKGSVLSNYKSLGVVSNPNLLSVCSRTPHIIKTESLQFCPQLSPTCLCSTNRAAISKKRIWNQCLGWGEEMEKLPTSTIDYNGEGLHCIMLFPHSPLIHSYNNAVKFCFACDI